MDKFKRTLALCSIIAAFCLSSCISTSNDIDLNKDISLDVQIGRGGLSIPVGSLSKIYLDSLIKTDGDDSVLDTLDGGLFGFTMDGTIDNVEIDFDQVKLGIPAPDMDVITTSFNAPTKDDLSLNIPEESNETTLEIASIDLDEINSKLPAFETEFTTDTYNLSMVPAGQTVNYTFNVPLTGTISKQISFKYDLPEDVEKLDTIYFGDGTYQAGQLITLDVDLGGIYSALNNPAVTISELNIAFPDNFILLKDNNLSGYITQGTISVAGNQFSITGGKVKDMTSSTSKKLPITFFMSKASFGNYGKNINYTGTISYSLKIGVNGKTKGGGSMFVYVNMSDALKMADFSVQTKATKVELESEDIESSCKIDGLDGMQRINYITFVPDDSYFKMSLSDFSIDPFKFGDDSYIRLVFSNDFVFDKTYDMGGKATWTTVGTNNNVLDINPAKAKGQDIFLHVERLDLYQDVDTMNASITLDNKVSYSADIEIAGKDNLHATDLENLGDKDIKFTVSGQLVIDDANFMTSEITTDFDQTTDISINSKVDTSLIALSEIELVQDAGVKFKLKFNGVPTMLDSMRISNLTIGLPDFLKISYTGDPNIRIGDDGHSLIISKLLTQAELADNSPGFIMDGLKIKGLAFKTPQRLQDGKLIIDDSVTVKGKAVVGSQKLELGGLNDIVVTPTVEFDSIIVKAVSGKVSPKIDAITESISLDLGDDVDFLKDASLKLKDPRITINLNSTVSVPIKLDLSLSSKDSDGDFIAESITPDKGTINLTPCDPGAPSRTTTLVIGQAVQDAESGDTLFVGMSRLSELMTTVPDSILFRLNAYTDTTVWHYIDITKDLTVSGDYLVTIPLSFDSLFVSYSDTIKDLGEDLKDFADKVIENLTMEVRADSIISTIPLGVKLKATALDKQGVPVPEITVDSCLIAAGDDEGRLLDPMVLKLFVEKGGLEKLDAFQFTAECQSDDNNSNGAIKKGQYLHVKGVKLKFPQGIVLDLSEKKKEDK